MKKTYMSPALNKQTIMTEKLISASITTVGGNSGIQMGEGETPEEADVKEGNFFGESIFD